jgi:hypothetical protein
MNEHSIPTFVLEDTIAAAASFANAKRIEDEVRLLCPPSQPLVFTNFTGSLVTGESPLPPTTRKRSTRRR